MISKLLLKPIAFLCIFFSIQLLHAEEPEFKIGAIYGLTGFANIWSVQAQRGIEMAVKEINESGGVGGERLELFLKIVVPSPLTP